MITIVFSQWYDPCSYLGQWFDRINLKFECIDFMQSTIGKPDKSAIRKENKTDPKSGDVMLYTYNSMTLPGFEFLDILRDYVVKNRLYVFIYDHESKTRKFFRYDEEEIWVEQKNIDLPYYLNITANRNLEGISV